MNYGRAIKICTNLDLEEFSESEILEAVSTILDMATINAVPKYALLNIVRYFWAHCVDQVENGEAEEYISREEAEKRIDEALSRVFVEPVGKSILSKLPAAEVKPVVRSYWEKEPHGRLIDADALLRMEQEQYEATIADNPNPWHRTLFEAFHITFRKTIENAPTVVPEVMK